MVTEDDQRADPLGLAGDCGERFPKTGHFFEGEKQSSPKLFQRCLLPLSVTGDLGLGTSLDEKLLRRPCSDLVLLGQTLSCASDKGHGAAEIHSEGGKGNAHTSLLESISDMVMLDVTCGMLLSLRRDMSLCHLLLVRVIALDSLSQRLTAKERALAAWFLLLMALGIVPSPL